MKSVEPYVKVRRAVYVEGLSRREAARRFGLGRDRIDNQAQPKLNNSDGASRIAMPDKNTRLLAASYKDSPHPSRLAMSFPDPEYEHLGWPAAADEQPMVGFVQRHWEVSLVPGVNCVGGWTRASRYRCAVTPLPTGRSPMRRAPGWARDSMS
jgi:hypothetical protein